MIPTLVERMAATAYALAEGDQIGRTWHELTAVERRARMAGIAAALADLLQAAVTIEDPATGLQTTAEPASVVVEIERLADGTERVSAIDRGMRAAAYTPTASRWLN